MTHIYIGSAHREPPRNNAAVSEFHAQEILQHTIMTTPQERTSGYAYGRVERSPVSLDELRKLMDTAGLDDAAVRALREAGEILAPHAEAMVDSWRSVIGGQEHLAKWFHGPDGKPDDTYKAAVKPRFVRWVADLCTRPFDQAWLDYQHEIGLRHTPAKKNQTDGAATPPVVPLRYLIAFAARVTDTARDQLKQAGVDGPRLERMHSAWTKAVILSVTLWSKPYTREDLW